MTGSVVLDVVIGLAFIFALYSLFATIIMELITSTLGLRARNLEYTIQRMLSDENLGLEIKTPEIKTPEIKIPETKKFGFTIIRERKIREYKIFRKFKILNNIIGRTFFSIFFGFTRFLLRDRDSENRKLYTGFFLQPSIKYLSAGGFHNKPSYISAGNFSKALLDELKESGNGDSPLQQIKTGIESLSVIPETKKQLKSLLAEANNDLQKFKLLLENWFEDVQERSAGWFKRTTKIWLLIIGFAIAVGLNADTLAIIKKLSIDPEARQQLVDMAISYAKENQETIDYITDTTRKDTVDSILKARLDTLLSVKKAINDDITDAQNIIASNWNIPDVLRLRKSPKDALHSNNPDTISFKYKLLVQDTLIVIKGDSVLHIRDTVRSKYAKKDIIKSLLNKGDSLIGKDTVLLVDSVDIIIQEKNCIIFQNAESVSLLVPRPLDPSIIKYAISPIIGRHNYDNRKISLNAFDYKWAYVFKNEYESLEGFWSYFWPPNYLKYENLLGYLLTALAISLGAPFWFDLLNKLMKLRGSIAKPARGSQTADTTKSDQSILERKG